MTLSPLPIDTVLQQVKEQLSQGTQLLLHAEPGAGKTTRVPLALLNEPWLHDKKLLMLEPRRLAATSAAEFMSSLLNEPVGQSVGYRTRGATKVSKGTRLEVVTEGILTRLLLDDPALSDYSAVLFDEFHERSVHSDLGLAFCLESQTSLRPDLRIIVMSATLEIDKVRGVLPDAPLVSCPGRSFPVEIRYVAPLPRATFEESFCDLVLQAERETEGDMLLFLPGKAEIMRVKEKLLGRAAARRFEVLTLLGELSLQEQRRALRPLENGLRKLLLATSIAETSLTIDGVRVVVDSGKMRVPRMDYGRGMTELVTVTVSKASATQRAGRAGRQTPGICYRMWSAANDHALAPFSTPEILQCDLAPVLLEAASWGARSLDSLALTDRPSPQAVREAQDTLTRLGALSDQGHITAHGRELVSLGLHPRLAHMVIEAQKAGCGGIACDVAALLEERDLLRGRAQDVDLTSRWHALDDFRKGKGEQGRRDVLARIERAASKLRGKIQASSQKAKEHRLGFVLGLAFPDWIARSRLEDGSNYLLANGAGASLPPGSFLARNKYLAIAALDGAGPNARIYLAEPLSEDDLDKLTKGKTQVKESAVWDATSNAVKGSKEELFGALVLRRQALKLDDEQALPLVLDAIRTRGLSVLPWSKESDSLKARLQWAKARKLLPEHLPQFSDDALLSTLENWLLPFLSGVRGLKDLERISLHDALLAPLSYHERALLDEVAPAFLTLPTGTKAWISYGENPSISVALQELFGATETPSIARGKVPLTVELLSPAKRPLQVTKDLVSFWDTTYPKLRTEMRAHYPRHEWPEDPRAAPPSRGRKPRHSPS